MVIETLVVNSNGRVRFHNRCIRRQLLPLTLLTAILVTLVVAKDSAPKIVVKAVLVRGLMYHMFTRRCFSNAPQRAPLGRLMSQYFGLNRVHARREDVLDRMSKSNSHDRVRNTLHQPL